MENPGKLVDAKGDVIAVDTAHGHSMGVIKMIKTIRKKYKHIQLIAGNIVTKEAALELDALDTGLDVAVHSGASSWNAMEEGRRL